MRTATISAGTRRQPAYTVACYGDVRGWGGGVSLTRAVAEQLAEREPSTTLIGVENPRGRRSAMPPRGLSWTQAPPPSRRAWRWKSWRAGAQLARWLRNLPPPSHAFVSASPFWTVAAARAWPGVRSVYLFPCLLTHCLPFARGAGSFWSRVDLAGVRATERAALRGADLILVPTQLARDEILRFEPSCAGRLARCDFGLRDGAIPEEQRGRLRRDLGIPADAFVALAAGVCDRNKAFDLLLTELRDTPARVMAVIVGAGPEAAALRVQASELGLIQRVRFMGSQPDLGRALAVCDVVVSTSHYDTYPNVLLEGLAARRPVLAPRHEPPHVYAGIAELLDAEGGGRTYERGRAGALGEQLTALANEPGTWASLAAQAQSLAARRLRWDELIDRIMQPTRPRASAPARSLWKGLLTWPALAKS